jgi:hypothetical protein
MRLRRVSAVAFALVAVLLGPMVLARQVPAVYFLLLVGPVALFVLSFIRTKTNDWTLAASRYIDLDLWPDRSRQSF